MYANGLWKIETFPFHPSVVVVGARNAPIRRTGTLRRPHKRRGSIDSRRTLLIITGKPFSRSTPLCITAVYLTTSLTPASGQRYYTCYYRNTYHTPGQVYYATVTRYCVDNRTPLPRSLRTYLGRFSPLPPTEHLLAGRTKRAFNF